MKCAFFACLCSLCAAYIPMDEAYGPVNETTEMEPWRKSAYESGQCHTPIEIVIIQDVSASLADQIETARVSQIDEMLTDLDKSHPGTKFSVVTFSDKPIWPFGEHDDYCQRFESRLSADASVLKETYQRLSASGGADSIDNQLGAILAAAQSRKIGWSEGEATRLIVLVTDSEPHFADDGMNMKKLVAFNGHFDDEKSDEQCVTEYYPSPAQVKRALNDRAASLAQLVISGEDRERSVRQSWKWFNKFLGQSPAMLEPLAKDGSNLASVLHNVVRSIEAPHCHLATLGNAAESTNTVGMQFEAGLAYKPKDN